VYKKDSQKEPAMIAPACTHKNRTKHGKDRKGNQRWKCARCGQTFTSEQQRPLGDMRTDLDRAVIVLGMLLEGMSIRACERLTGMKRDTICDLVLTVGDNCQRYLETAIHNVPAETIELDEIWSFVRMKEKTRMATENTEDVGDSWTWLATDATTKLVLARAIGQRDEATCTRFLDQLNYATTGRCQVTSDGLRLYTHNVPYYLGSRCDFAQLVKQYAASPGEGRYSPASIISAEKTVRFGQPDEDKISTSHSERLNLSVRMHIRRWTRLTNAHSKSQAHHAAMMALFVAWYNYCRPNMALGKKVSPAMAAGLTEKVWSIQELLEAAA